MARRHNHFFLNSALVVVSGVIAFLVGLLVLRASPNANWGDNQVQSVDAAVPSSPDTEKITDSGATSSDSLAAMANPARQPSAEIDEGLTSAGEILGWALNCGVDVSPASSTIAKIIELRYEDDYRSQKANEVMEHMAEGKTNPVDCKLALQNYSNTLSLLQVMREASERQAVAR